jgi:hypothetical protein
MNFFSRPTHSGVSGDAIYPVNEESVQEQNRADAISRIGATDAAAAATFFPPERLGGLLFEDAWHDWLAKDFVAWLGPKFIEIHLAAARMASDRIAEIDHEIDAALSETARRRSRSAALPYLEGRTEVRQQPQWVKFLRAQKAGEIPGHLTSIFALQAALFHLPLLPALTAYVNFEGANGLAAMAGGERLDPETFAIRHPEGLEAARRVFRLSWDDDDSASPTGHLACV